MKCTITFYTLILSCFYLNAQYYIGTVSEDFEYTKEKIHTPPSSFRERPPKTYQQLEGFPIGFPANSNFKNFRNVTLEDINGDGLSDIIFAANHTLYAISKGKVLWTKPLTGVGIYPPSIADLDKDGQLEIVQATGGQNEKGRIYVMDINGNDLAGWPKNYEDHWIITSPTLSDVDEDGAMEIVFLERISSTLGNIHILRKNGETLNDNWPVAIPGTPAVTPTIGDVDNDGEKDILICSTSSMFLFDLHGDLKPGWPVEDPNTKFSFQSPMLADLNQDGTLEIIGATHGEVPEFYIRQFDGSPYKAWPFIVPQRARTFSSPTVVPIEGEHHIFMSRPNTSGTTSENLDMLYSWNGDGNLSDGFPIEKTGGLEAGIISIADIDSSPDFELIFGSNMFDSLGNGFIHAYKMDGSGELAGFPLSTRGWTLSNGIAIDDVTGDGRQNLVALSYTVNFGAKKDSIFLNIYEMDQPHQKEKVLWSTFKGSNTREGITQPLVSTPIKDRSLTNISLAIHPNPVKGNSSIFLGVKNREELQGDLFNAVTGQFIKTLFKSSLNIGMHQISLPDLENGSYLLKVTNEENKALNGKILVIK